MISYHDFIDTQERSSLTEDEQLEKKNTKIINLYTTGANSIYHQDNPKNMATKPQTDKAAIGKGGNKRTGEKSVSVRT